MKATRVAAAPYLVARKNNPVDLNAPVVIPGAALQADARVINISFDPALPRNAAYGLGLDPTAARRTAGGPPPSPPHGSAVLGEDVPDG